MLNTIIIEDERPSRESLLQTLARIDADVNLLAAMREEVDDDPLHVFLIHP